MRIVEVHTNVSQMYHNYIASLQQTVEQMHAWAAKFKVANDRRQMRETALKNFNKVHLAYEKKCANKSQAPKVLKERKDAEQEARLAFTHLESQNN